MKNTHIKQALFYIRLLFYKATSFLECKNYRLKVIMHELNFLLFTLGLKQLSSSNTHRITLNTHLGNFTIRDMTNDIIIASPSYEKQDLNELLSQIQTSLSAGHKVLFLDIGACFGKFTVAVGKKFRSYKKNLSILSFEPDPVNFKLLKQNILLNRLKNTKIFRSTLSNNEIRKQFYYFRPMKQIVSFPTNETIYLSTTKLDTYLHSMPKERNTDVFIKLDAEGHEKKFLKAAPSSSNTTKT